MLKRLKNPIFAAKVILVMVVCVLAVWALRHGDYFRLMTVAITFVLVFLCDIVRKVRAGWRVTTYMELVYLTFMFVAMVLGIDLELYEKVPYLDKVVHTASGVLTAGFAVYILRYFGLEKSNNHFRGLFIVVFSMGVAAGWELFEFACDQMAGTRMQNLVSEGVGDTMFDLLAATVGAVVTAYYIERKRRRGQRKVL